ncbi:MAG: hypothetical protein BJ554DRAFT_4075 [Olpidium bornovanus]|uniref:COP9 signalosome complex subunit 3 N-terminal helical repeats domain-containing protein n=1 Tax=Olpidium bornovanus TaxID=278681 RepID=A0A8H7ZN90_9FUNG|nr:MAG: hypothetical protein BJ554DRAFT_4075 [Olpidium bornovanus]
MITADSLVSEVLAEPDPCELDKKLSTAGVRGALVDLQKPFTATAAPGLPSAEDASGGSTPAPQGNDGSLADPLDALSPSEHSLGYLHFLYGAEVAGHFAAGRVSSAGVPTASAVLTSGPPLASHARVATVQIPMTNDPYPLLRRIATFLCSFDPRQVRWKHALPFPDITRGAEANSYRRRYIRSLNSPRHRWSRACFTLLVGGLDIPRPPDLSTVLSAVSFALVSQGVLRQALFGIKPLVAALRAFAPSPAHITGLHTVVIKIEPDSLHVNVTDYLQYHYYAGMVNIGLKKFRDAASMFIAVSSPALPFSR